MGMVSDIIATFCRKPLFGYKPMVYSLAGIAGLGFIVWGHHMFQSGMDPRLGTGFMIATIMIALPSAVKVFNWLSTLYKADIRLDSPMLYAMGFIILFTIGGLTGLFLGTLAVDVPLYMTYFVVAHFHYVAVGSTLFAFVGGMNYWFPKMFGRMVNEKWAKIAFVFVFVGFNLTFFPQFIAGSRGMPRRYASYPPQFVSYHHASTIGAYTMGFGLLLVGLNWLHGMRRGRKAPDNPWGANTLEWRSPSPPPHDNFLVQPEADDPYDLSGWRYESPEKGWVYDAEQAAQFAAAHPLH
jgi:cytochrome c oxidase subunit 1